MTAARNPNSKDGGARWSSTARAANEFDAELARLACPIEQAATALRRRGVIVYRMSVHDGDRNLWFVNGLGRDVTPEQLILEAGKITK